MGSRRPTVGIAPTYRVPPPYLDATNLRCSSEGSGACARSAQHARDRPHGDTNLAKNNDKHDGHLDGAVRDRSQTKTPSGHWVKRDAESGKFLDVKHDDKPFKGVRKEK